MRNYSIMERDTRFAREDVPATSFIYAPGHRIEGACATHHQRIGYLCALP
jgi:hypothetical protein